LKVALTIGIGPVKLTFSPEELASLKARFTKNPIANAPCMILNRATGLALDATRTTISGTHNKLWNAHAGPHQQWRIRALGNDNVEIVSEQSGMLLTAMARPHDWGEVWLDRKKEADWSTRWRLKESRDKVAFVIENANSGYALDAGRDAKNGADPHLWRTTWDPWQQWIIARLPLT
jgi:Ricin-type beta-trefoil lectin domain-like